MTRAEHMRWCKERALQYADRGDLSDAVASMASDLGKHPETEMLGNSPLNMIGLMAAIRGDHHQVHAWITGFAE